nr:MAG TPA: Lethal factor [Caudoviricetes sp.]
MGSCSSSGKASWTGTDGVDPSEVRSTANLLIDTKLDEATRSEVVSTLKDFQSEFGINYNNTRIADMKQSSRSLAYYDHEGIAVNNKYANSVKMNRAYDQCVQSGYHPSRGRKTGMQAVMAHEIWHQLNDMIGSKMGVNLHEAANRIVKEATKLTKHKSGARLASKISGYAKSSPAEAIAEAVADVYCNGKKARSESRAISNIVRKYLSI